MKFYAPSILINYILLIHKAQKFIKSIAISVNLKSNEFLNLLGICHKMSGTYLFTFILKISHNWEITRITWYRKYFIKLYVDLPQIEICDKFDKIFHKFHIDRVISSYRIHVRIHSCYIRRLNLFMAIKCFASSDISCVPNV